MKQKDYLGGYTGDGVKNEEEKSFGEVLMWIFFAGLVTVGFLHFGLPVIQHLIIILA